MLATSCVSERSSAVDSIIAPEDSRTVSWTRSLDGAVDLEAYGDTLFVLTHTDVTVIHKIDPASGQSLAMVELPSQTEAPLAFSINADRFVVRTERARVLIHDRYGELIHERGGEASPSIATNDLGAIWIPGSQYVGFYTEILEREWTMRPFAARVSDRPRRNPSYGEEAFRALLAPGPGQGLYVFDNRLGLVAQYDSAGAFLGDAVIPQAELDSTIEAGRPAVGQGRSPIAASLKRGCDGSAYVSLFGRGSGALVYAGTQLTTRAPYGEGITSDRVIASGCAGFHIALDREAGLLVGRRGA